MDSDVALGAMAERAARAGGVVARKSFRGALTVETKANKNDLVTEVDHDAQRQVLATIRQEYPDDAFVCEEAESRAEFEGNILEAVPDEGRAWVVDPIDGTANFVRGMHFWATSVAVVEDGDTVGVATYLPAIEDSYTAGPDSASRNGESLAVSERTDPETFAVGLLGWWPARASDEQAAIYREATSRFGDVRRLGCLQGELALVAAGGLDGALMPTTPLPWDAIGGVHLIRQAGGTATDVHGDPWQPQSTGLVVSNGACHDELVGAVRAGLTDER